MRLSAISLLLCICTVSVVGQTFQNGFNFYLPSYDTTTQAFLPDFPIETIGPNDFVTVTADGNFEVKGKQFRIYGNNIWTDPGLYPDNSKSSRNRHRRRWRTLSCGDCGTRICKTDCSWYRNRNQKIKGR